MIVEHTFGGMKDVALVDPSPRKSFQHVIKITVYWLVTADVFCGVDAFEPEKLTLSVLVRTTSL